MLQNKSICLPATIMAVGLLSGCATTPVAVGPPSSSALPSTIPRGETIFLLPPSPSYELAHNEALLPAAQYGANAACSLMASNARDRLREKGMHVLTPEDMPQGKKAEVETILGKLALECQTLASFYRSKQELIPVLQELQEVSGASAAFVQTLRVKVGMGGGWDPYTGQIWQGTSSSDVKVALISLRTGEHLWANEVFVRCLPYGARFAEAVRLLFEEPSPKSGRHQQ